MPSPSVLSLQARLLLAASVVLVVFLGLTGLTLDRAFQNSARSALNERLQAYIYMVLGAVEIDAAGRLANLPELPDARFATPGSGLVASVSAAEGRLLWRSPSSLGLDIPYPSASLPGEPRYAALHTPDGASWYAESFLVSWETSPGNAHALTFHVAEDAALLGAEISGFRLTLWGWLAAATLLLLATQGLVLHWGLAPLRDLAREVAEIETGRQTAFVGRYPRELHPLTENLNALVHHDRAHLERYRNALDDLAHSLKTPLAVLRNAREAPEAILRESLDEQLDRMVRTVDYQLQRAAAAGSTGLAASTPVAGVLEKLARSLAKVYPNRELDLSIAVSPELRFAGDEGDLMEIAGNLLDNAWKWANSRVGIHAWSTSLSTGDGKRLLLEVEDDGPGIPEDQRRAVLARGVRGTREMAGQGIGLAVVRSLVEEVYGGRVDIESRQTGGTRVRVVLPG